MLQRNLLYTALTRARQMVILVGSAKAVRVAVRADTPNRRRSLLGWRLNPDLPSDFCSDGVNPIVV
jgi:exodeoxyribonuclease V alpha subunit